MKRLLLASTLTASLCFAPTTIDATTLKDDNILTISPTHTFTITFSDDVKKNESLIKEIAILTTASPVTFTKAISGNTMTLDPTTDLQPNETYTVEVKLADGKKTKQSFFTTSNVKTPISTFKEQYPQYANASLITTMQEQLDEVAYLSSIGEKPSTALAKAVNDIPATVESFKTAIGQIESLYKNAATTANAATANETDVSMQLDALRTMCDMHIMDATSLTVLTRTHQTRENAVRLLTATQKATDSGLELVSSLEELNNAMSDIYIVAPTSQPNMHYVNSLQTSFNQNIQNVAASDSTITKQIEAIDTLLENVIDYTNLMDDVNYFIQDVESAQQQFASWKDATDIPNVVTTYPSLQQLLLSINNKIASTSSIEAIETTLSSANDTFDQIVTDLPTYIDTYLEKEIEYLNASLENVETAADAKELDYMTLEAYLDADEAILNIESTYSFYDETIQYNTFKADLKAAHDKIAALKRELGV